MDFLGDILPSSIFGHQMPWAHEKPTTAPEPQKPIEPTATPSSQDVTREETTLEQDSIPPEIPSEATRTLDSATSIEDGLSKLKIEQFASIEQRATDLHEKSKGVNAKIKLIDEFLSIIQDLSTQHPKEPIDCQNADLKRVTELLRQQGIRVPLPEKTLEAGQIGNVFTVMNNQRSLLADQLKEHSSEFQQCTVERNTLLQHLMSMVSGLSRAKNKIAMNFFSRTR